MPVSGFALRATSRQIAGKGQRILLLCGLCELCGKKKLELETLNLEVAIGDISHEHQNIDQNRRAGL